ncbi:MAG TPA: hypothetical protein PK264_23755, partial [Hyphomicrobiaceae bacterium]|nr:hypothetical protein [Hyphomicrobiaceae bacterium]
MDLFRQMRMLLASVIPALVMLVLLSSAAAADRPGWLERLIGPATPIAAGTLDAATHIMKRPPDDKGRVPLAVEGT